jgi:hypothetical protein
MQALEVRRVPSSPDLSKPGDYYFLAKRPPIVTYERKALEAPEDNGGTNTMYLLRLLWWKLFGKKYEMKQIVQFQWPEFDVAILNCPDCNQPLATTAKHKIVSIEPLTIESAVSCPYTKTFHFEVKEGKIIPIIYHAA